MIDNLDKKKELDRVTERLNDALDAAETILVNLAKGAAPAFVGVTGGQIGVRRLGDHPGEWQLVWVKEGQAPQPLANAPRSVRVEAAYKLRDLKIAVLLAIHEEYKTVSDAAEKAWDFCQSEVPSD
jgi:hypothetical protein